MPPKRITSTKTLFDDIFATIPANVFLEFGATTVMEAVALEEAALEDNGARQLAKAAPATAMYAPLEDGEEDEATSTSAQASTGAARPIIQSMGLTHVGVAGPGQRAKTATGARVTFALELDTEDEAVREATKYAAFVQDAQARESQIAEARLAQHNAQLQEVLYTGEETADRPTMGSRRSHTQGRLGRTGYERGGGGGVQGGASDQLTSAPPPASSGTGTHDPSNSAVDGTGVELADGEDGLATMGTGRAVGAARPNLSPEEQVACMPPGLRTIYTGRCAMIRHGKDYGFIAPDLGGPDIYFTREGVFYTFTRLALRSYYEKNGLPVPVSVSRPLEVMQDAAKLLAASTQETQADGEAKEETEVDAAPVTSEVRNDTDGAAQVVPPSPTPPLQSENPTTETAPSVPAPSDAVDGTDDALDADNAPLLEEEVGLAEAGEGEAIPEEAEQPATPGSVGVGILPTPAVRVQQPVVSEAMLAASRMVNMRESARDRLLSPPLTAAEVEKAEAAAALLTPQTAQLLQWQVDLGTGTVAVHERVSFTAHWNKAAAHGKGSRLLRGEHVRGQASNAYALQVEQAWFCALFPDATGRKHADERPQTADAAASSSSTTILERYVGTVRGFVAEEQRGYLRPDEPNAQDVIFTAEALLWDPLFPPASRVISDRMRVCYSVAGRDRQRYTATLITAVDGTPLTPNNVVMADDSARRGGGGRRGGGEEPVSGAKRAGDGGDGARDGGGGGGGGRENRRKRVREEEALLLFDESDYASMI